VTKDFGFRVIVNSEFETKLQFVQLLYHQGIDAETGQKYSFITKQTFIDMRSDLELDMSKIAQKISKETIRTEVIETHQKWYDAFIPKDSAGEIDQIELERKIKTAIIEDKKRNGEELIRKNKSWIEPAIPRLINDFKKGLYLKVDHQLYDTYKEKGGEDTEDGLIRKMLLFYRIYETKDNQDLLKPDDRNWHSEDEIWDCWVAFSGSEFEAKRVCATMNTVMRPLQAVI
jgi:hypothetical protein